MFKMRPRYILKYRPLNCKVQPVEVPNANGENRNKDSRVSESCLFTLIELLVVIAIISILARCFFRLLRQG